MESDSLSWPILTWYFETRSIKNRNLNYNWYSGLLDTYFTIRRFSKYWPYPLSLRSFTVFRHFFIDTSNWSISRPLRAIQGIIFKAYITSFSSLNSKLTYRFQKTFALYIQWLHNFLIHQFYSGTFQTVRLINLSLRVHWCKNVQVYTFKCQLPKVINI